MTPREQRKIRKVWREKARKRRQCLALQDITNAPITSNSNNEETLSQKNPNARVIAAKKKSDRARRLRYKIIKKQNQEISKLKTTVERYRKQVQRVRQQKPKEFTPSMKVDQMLNSPNSKEIIKKKLLFGEVLNKQLQENFSTLSTDKEKKLFRRMISGKLVNKYGILQEEMQMKPLKKINKLRFTDLKRKTRKDNLSDKLKRKITEFLEDDSNSRLCAGKKDFITKKGERKQKRVLLDTMLNLYKLFLVKEDIIISYSFFCKLRPFWIIQPHCDKRETCLCIIHANFDLALCALFQAKITSIPNHQCLLNKICCNRYDEKCLSRECQTCKNKGFQYKEFNNSVPITYKKWQPVSEDITESKTGKARKIRKYCKKTFQTYPRDFIIQMESDLNLFLQHEFNIVHQYKAIKTLKESLTEKDCLIHMDFSENYQTKYFEEIQAFHFGGSRQQISLHTVVVYTRRAESEIQTRCYCTMTTNLKHSPTAIWAHLQPVLDALPASVENLHFLSDGPVTQYRNKFMFYLLATHLQNFYPNLTSFTWNYHEAGHGKGAPDGVGAVCKRTADRIVASGTDIASLNDLSCAIEKNCPNIKVFVINDSELSQKEALLHGREKSIKTFANTLRVHQIVGNVFLPNELQMKTLSCFCRQNCSHYKIGTFAYVSSVNECLFVFGMYMGRIQNEKK